MRELWEKYQRGDHLTTEELEKLRFEANVALPFLRSHPDTHLVHVLALRTVQNIDEYLGARKTWRREIAYTPPSEG